ncbi:MAG: type 4a pilus biogenesis protein PilO [Burkholderiaceae bacterium]|jgi:type IV pilus assembly protein PilO|nr:type 4a pilus biogenesis protein PilO [Burkholderiaceae bacterium]
MATKSKKSSANIDFSALTRRLNAQFQGLDPSDPSSWPAIPRYALLLVVAVAVLTLLWFFALGGPRNDLDSARAEEVKLRGEYTSKSEQAATLGALNEQKKQVTQYVETLEKQLPAKNEMDALLSDINQAGLSRGLQFELFKPNAVVLKDYYAELPISIKIKGYYHEIGAFAADVASFSRIVTLSDINLAPAADKDKSHPGQLTLTATARTYRYLDPEEVEAQRKATAKKGHKK